VIAPEPLVESLIAVGRWMSARSLLPATAGNLSARVSATHAVVTASGVDKGELRADDFIVLDVRAPTRAPCCTGTRWSRR
jgi:methylthioribulose-1-phosphate dehydratase